MKELEKTIDESIQGSATLIEPKSNDGKKLYIESYGCQMNFSDSEIVASILSDSGFNTTKNIEEADVVFVNTCSIREKAELTVRNRLKSFTKYKKQKPELIIGVLGCMAERVKSKFLDEEKLVDIVVGPDAYRDLPNLVNQAEDGRKAVNVLLSKEETYADISPVRLLSNGVTAFISITRGCDNMCTFCVVPFTRGRERSRNPESILNEAQDLFERGFREVTLLGQNVDSYLWHGQEGLRKEFDALSDEEKALSVNFAQLIEKVAQVNPLLRVRFSTSHPKDISDDVLHIINRYENICKHIHLPVQSGSTRILELMNRGYSREWYLERIKAIKTIIPSCTVSSDIISGFCSETEEDHQDTLSLMEVVKYDFAFMFSYSERPNTQAERKFDDDIDEETKKRRLQEIIDLQKIHSLERNRAFIGKDYKILIEGLSKKSDQEFYGRTSQNTVVVFPKGNHKIGDYINVHVNDCTRGTLLGSVID